MATALAVGVHQFRRAATVLAAAAVLTTGLGAGAYGVATASVAHNGSIPTSGPVSRAAWAASAAAVPGRRGRRARQLAQLLATTTTKWAAATEGAQSAATLELASGKAVIGIGGFGGSDPAPDAGAVPGVREGGPGPLLRLRRRRGRRPRRVERDRHLGRANYTATTVGGSTVYDLTG